jgi:uncharacterized protein Yka (UPF0111/DUF47 family)
MKIRLFPKNEKFFELFKEDAANLKEGIEALQDIIENYVDIDKKFLRIKSIEHQGDILTHDIITRLRGTFITPLEREDIHELAHLGKLGHVHTFCSEVNNLEYQADIIGQQAIADLFEKTQRVEDLKELLKLKEIYERLERAADRCEDVANVIEGITVKMT